MSKGQDSKKNAKKKPLLTAKEKKAAKKSKKAPVGMKSAAWHRHFGDVCAPFPLLYRGYGKSNPRNALQEFAQQPGFLEALYGG